jgi:uncharacterized membrane protein
LSFGLLSISLHNIVVLLALWQLWGIVVAPKEIIMSVDVSLDAIGIILLIIGVYKLYQTIKIFR